MFRFVFAFRMTLQYVLRREVRAGQRAKQPFLRLQIQQVPHTPVRFRLPSACDFCQAKGTIVPGTTVHGNTVLMVWVCRECGRDRPITRAEQKPERRSRQPDRRRTTRKERRRPN